MFKENQQNVKNMIRLITKEENEDLEQEVYVKAWRNSEKYSERGTFSAWINTIAKNVSRDYLKSAYKKNKDNSTSDDLVINTIKDRKAVPELRLIQNDRQRQIISAINMLKPKFKEVVMLCEIEGYSYEQAAQSIKCPVGTVKSRLYNAKKFLADELKDLL